MNLTARSWLVTPLWLSLACILGCGGGNERCRVHGKVTLDGQPVTLGSIVLTPIEPTKSPSAGASLTEGTYDIGVEKGPLPGTFQVEIKIRRLTGRRVPVGSPAPPGTMADEMIEVKLPPDLNPPTKLEVRPGTIQADFDLHSAK